VFLPVNDKQDSEMARSLEPLRSLVQEAGIHFLDLNQFVDATIPFEVKQDLFLHSEDPCHFNRDGHLLISYLLNKNLPSLLKK